MKTCIRENMKTCKWVLQQILNILEKGVNTEQERDKILQLIESFKKRHLHIAINLEKFEQLCSTACYNPEILLEERKRSKCIKIILEIEQKLTKTNLPISEELRRELIEKIKAFLNYVNQKYLRAGPRRLKELIEENMRLKKECEILRDECERLRRCVEECEILRGEVERLRDLSVSYAGRVLDLEGRLRRCRRRVRELCRRVRSCESTVQNLSSILELLWRENERLEELAWVWFQEYRIASTERDIYISLVASLSGTIARLLDENERLWSRVRELENEIARLRSRVNELENSFLGFIATIREIGSELPDKIRRRLLREVGKYLLQ